ncbi:MAG: hypothetical protein KUG77_29400 [Nannocystaceae bacterium]|nr:hypothetical protein [Nannocystaceae bacterium]
MSWAITKQKPLAGVSKDKKGRVVLDLAEAFDAAPTFEQVARHVGLSPRDLLADLLSEEGYGDDGKTGDKELDKKSDEALMATRHLVMRLIYETNDPEGSRWETGTDLRDPERMRDIIEWLAEKELREDIYADEQVRPNAQTKRFPLWLIPTNIKGKSVVFPAPLTASTADLISLRKFHWDDIHGYLEANQEDFVELREQSERLYLASRAYITETRRIKKEVGKILQPMNDLAVMITNMLAYTTPPMDHHAHVEASRKNRRIAAEVAADLQHGVSLVSEHFFGTEDHPVVKARANKFRIIKHALSDFPGEAASKLMMLDDLGPPGLRFEYLRGMEACAAALSMADPADAGPLLEKHFMHLLVSVVEEVDPIDVGGLDGVKKTLAEAANSFDIATLKKLDKKASFPALAIMAPRTDAYKNGRAQMVKWVGSPASIVGTLSNYALMAVAASTPSEGTASAGMLIRVGFGVAGKELARRKPALFAMLAQASGENSGKKMAFEDALKREAKKQITETANKLQTKITASTQGLTAAMSTISFALDLSGMLAAFGEIRRQNDKDGDSWDSEDWLKAVSAVYSVAGHVPKFVAAVDSLAARSYAGAGQAIALRGQGIGKLADWAEIANSKVLPVVEIAIGLWSVRETQLKSIRWGHESEAGFEAFCLVVGLISYVHPLAGFVATAVLGVIKVLKDIDGGSNGMHAYYEYQRGQIVTQLKGIKGMKQVANKWAKEFKPKPGESGTEKERFEKWHKVLDVRNDKLPRLERLYALQYTLNEWAEAMRPVSMPSFAVRPGLQNDVDDLLRRQGFSERAIELVQDRNG